MIKSLPNARDIWALIAVAPGTTMSSFDVGGSRAGTQTGYSAYGRGDQVRVQVDGANSTEDTGGTGYFNYGAFEEVSIGTDSNDASMPTPGVQINAVVKSGGNQFRGDLYTDFQHSSMQGQNVTDEIRRKGLGEGTRITKYYDPNLGIGGPIKRDKIWYFVSLRKQFSGSNIGGFPVEDPGTFEFTSQLENITEKTTYQLSQNNKLSQFFEIRRKLQPSRDASSTRYLDAVYKQESISSYGTVEWNSVVSPSFFMNTRFSSWGYNWPNYAYGPDGLGENIQPRRTERLTGNVTGGAREDKTFRRRYQVDWSGTLLQGRVPRRQPHRSRRVHRRAGDAARSRQRLRRRIHGDVRQRVAARAISSGRGACRSPTRRASRPTTCATWARSSRTRSSSTRRLTINAGFRWDYYLVNYPDQEIREGAFRNFFYAGRAAAERLSRSRRRTLTCKVPGRDVVVRVPRRVRATPGRRLRPARATARRCSKRTGAATSPIQDRRTSSIRSRA